MFDNIGKKIKALAVAIFVFGTIGSIIIGIVYLVKSANITHDDLIAEYRSIGAMTMFGGPGISWISSWFTYGFGELIDKVSDIERNTGTMINPTKLKVEHERQESERKEAEIAEQKKAAAKERIAAEKERIAKEENSVLVVCPECGEALYFHKELSSAECPYCGYYIKIKE